MECPTCHQEVDAVPLKGTYLSVHCDQTRPIGELGRHRITVHEVKAGENAIQEGYAKRVAKS